MHSPCVRVHRSLAASAVYANPTLIRCYVLLVVIISREPIAISSLFAISYCLGFLRNAFVIYATAFSSVRPSLSRHYRRFSSID